MANTHETRFLLTAKDKTKAAFGSVHKGMAGLKKSVTGLHTGFIALASAAGAGLLTKSLIDVNAEFQTIKSSLATMTGGTKEAAAAFELIEKFATTTPFDLQQVTQSFIKLKAMGLDPSEAALRSYGNTASAMGKSMDQMIEAVADAATGEFERLKEFGIKSAKAGADVTFTFQGVATTIKNTSANVQKYLRDIGDVNFASAMDDQMKNLAPAFSNFSTAIDMLKVSVGEAGFNELIAGITNEMTAFINSLDAEAVERFTRDSIGGLLGALQKLSEWGDAIGAGADSTGDFLASLPGQPFYAGDGIEQTPGAFIASLPGTATDPTLERARAAGGGSFEAWRESIQSGNKELEKQTTFLEKLIDVTERASGATAQ